MSQPLTNVELVDLFAAATDQLRRYVAASERDGAALKMRALEAEAQLGSARAMLLMRPAPPAPHRAGQDGPVAAHAHNSRECGGANTCPICQAVVRERFPRFPIQTSYDDESPHPPSVPWRLAELAYPVYSANGGRGQSLEMLATRAGLGWQEFACFLGGHYPGRCPGRIRAEEREPLARCRAAALLAVERDAVAAERRRVARVIQDAASRAFLPDEPVEAIRRALLHLRERVLELEDEL